MEHTTPKKINIFFFKYLITISNNLDYDNSDKITQLYDIIDSKTKDQIRTIFNVSDWKRIVYIFNNVKFMPYTIFQQLSSYDTLYIYSINGKYLRNIYSIKPIDPQSYIDFCDKVSNCILSEFNKSSKYDLLLFLIDYDKKLPIEGDIGVENVNSGATMHKGLDNIPLIKLYRKEEYHKVLIHEIVHTTEMENIYNEKDAQIFKKCGVYHTEINEILFGEAITEAIAQYINCLICGKSISDEVDHSLIQSAKVLQYYGINKIDQIINNKVKITQGTAVFEYYVLRGILIYLWAKNGNNHTFYDYMKSNNICQIVYNVILNDIEWKNRMDKLLSNKIDDNSLRMASVSYVNQKGGNLYYEKYKKYKQKYFDLKDIYNLKNQ